MAEKAIKMDKVNKVFSSKNPFIQAQMDAIHSRRQFGLMKALLNREEYERKRNERLADKRAKTTGKSASMTPAYYEMTKNGKISQNITANGGFLTGKQKPENFKNVYSGSHKNQKKTKMSATEAFVNYLFDNRNSTKNRGRDGLSSIFFGPESANNPENFIKFMDQNLQDLTKNGLKLDKNDAYKWGVSTLNDLGFEHLDPEIYHEILLKGVEFEANYMKNQGINVLGIWLHLGENSPHIHFLAEGFDRIEIEETKPKRTIKPQFIIKKTGKSNFILTPEGQQKRQKIKELSQKQKDLRAQHHDLSAKEKKELKQLKDELYTVELIKTGKKFIPHTMGGKRFDKEFLKQGKLNKIEHLKKWIEEINKQYNLNLIQNQHETTLAEYKAKNNYLKNFQKVEKVKELNEAVLNIIKEQTQKFADKMSDEEKQKTAERVEQVLKELAEVKEQLEDQKSLNEEYQKEGKAEHDKVNEQANIIKRFEVAGEKLLKQLNAAKAGPTQITDEIISIMAAVSKEKERVLKHNAGFFENNDEIEGTKKKIKQMIDEREKTKTQTISSIHK